MTLSEEDIAAIALQIDAMPVEQRRDAKGTDGAIDRPLSYADLIDQLRQRVMGR